jgi:hypothetical protein
MIAIFAFAGASLASATLLAVWALLAERRCGDAKVDAAELAGRLAIADADVATYRSAASRLELEVHSLDDELAQIEKDAGGDPATALQRLLSKWRARAGAAGGQGGNAVSVTTAAKTAGPGDDGLLRPGE